MSIQSSIHQGISLVSLLVSQSPAAEAQRTRAREEAEATMLKEKYDRAVSAENEALDAFLPLAENPKISGTTLVESEEYKLYEEAGARVGRIEEEMFYRDPSAQSAKQVITRRRETNEQRELARQAVEDEQRRIAIYNEITRPFDPKTDKFRW